MIPEIRGLRIPPHSAEAERGILGSILFDSDESIRKCERKGVTHTHFYDRRHQCLFEQLIAMSQAGRPMDAITIGDWLKNHNALEKVGGYEYLVDLQDDSIVSGHVEFYCDTVIEKKMARTVIEQASDAIDRSYNGAEADDIISDLTTGVVGLRRREIKATSTADIMGIYHAAANGSSRCIPTPFDGLSMRTGGPMRGMETILTGRAKSGKSMLKSFWHRYLGKLGIPTLDCPWEDGEIIAKSRCASIGKYNAGQLIRGGNYIRNNDKWAWMKTQPRSLEVAERSLKELEDYPMFWDEERVGIKNLKSKIAGYVEEHGVQVVFLDGAKDILRPSDMYNDTGSEEAISHGITEVARSLDIAIISIYHLTKLAHDELIRSGNIRGSGQIVSNSRLVYALQGDKNGAGLGNYSDAKVLDYNEEGYCTTRALECIDNNHGDLGKTWLDCDLGLCSFGLM